MPSLLILVGLALCVGGGFYIQKFILFLGIGLIILGCLFLFLKGTYNGLTLPFRAAFAVIFFPLKLLRKLFKSSD